MSAKVDASEAIQGMRRARREAGKLAKGAQREAAEEAILPEARRRAPTFARSRIAARARRTSAFLATSLPARLDRVVGLLEFGGAIRTPLRPKKRRALRLRDGSFVMAVNKPRKIEAKRLLQGAVEARFGDYQEALVPKLMRAFDDFEHTP